MTRHSDPIASPRPLEQSNRLAAVQTPIIPVVADLIRQHPGTISLGQGVVSYGPPPESRAALDRFWGAPEVHKYKAVEGIPELREALAGKLRTENGIEIGDATQVVVTAGGNLAFDTVLQAIADPGDEVILQTPYYFNHEMAVTMASCRPVLVPTDAAHQLQPELIRRAINPRTRALVTVSPNNPSGAVYPETTLREVNAICRDAGIFHIHDEAYEYFTWDGARHFSPGSIPGAAPHTLCLYSLSKAYGFASWRIGYFTVPTSLLTAVRKIQDTLLICPPVISQYAALGALQAGRAYCDAQREPIARARGLFLSELGKLEPRCEAPPALGAFYFLLRLRSRLDPLDLVSRLVREHRVAAIPGTAFGLETGCAVRVAYGALDPAIAEEGVRRLVRGLDALCA